MGAYPRVSCFEPNNFSPGVHAGYDGRVLGSLGRRAVEAVVALFALLGFFFVPLGQHTGFEHAKAVFTTPAAGRAVRELGQALIALRARLASGLTSEAERNAKRPALPRDENGPKPVPPELR